MELEWTAKEEILFAKLEIMAGIGRIPAIHLWKRCGKDEKKAVAKAIENLRLKGSVSGQKSNMSRLRGRDAE